MKLKLIKIIFSVFALLTIAACGDNTKFTIGGRIDGLGTRAVYVIYAANGNITKQMTAAIDGKFSISGESPDYTIVELFAASSDPLARMLVKNGQTLSCKLSIDEPLKNQIKGNKPTEEWITFLRQNNEILSTGTPEMIDRLIGGYVADHRDNIVSSLLLLTSYNSVDHESQADSLFALIAPQARPEKLVEGYRMLLSLNNTSAFNVKVKSFSLYSYGDSTEWYMPSRSSYSLLYFTDGAHNRRDTIISKITPEYEKYSRKRFKVVDVSMTPDTLEWKRTAVDSLAWAQVWVPGGVANPQFDNLNIPRLPYYILTDSTGRQVYRGTQLTIALDSLDRCLSKKN